MGIEYLGDGELDGVRILSPERIRHFDYPNKQELTTEGWFPEQRPVNVILTAGASCPDALLDEVVREIIGWFPDARPVDDVLAPFEADAPDAVPA